MLPLAVRPLKLWTLSGRMPRESARGSRWSPCLGDQRLCPRTTSGVDRLVRLEAVVAGRGEVGRAARPRPVDRLRDDAVGIHRLVEVDDVVDDHVGAELSRSARMLFAKSSSPSYGRREPELRRRARRRARAAASRAPRRCRAGGRSSRTVTPSAAGRRSRCHRPRGSSSRRRRRSCPTARRA